MKRDLSKEIAEKLEKLRDLEVLSNDHSNVISGLISLAYTMKRFISDFGSDISVYKVVEEKSISGILYPIEILSGECRW